MKPGPLLHVCYRSTRVVNRGGYSTHGAAALSRGRGSERWCTWLLLQRQPRRWVTDGERDGAEWARNFLPETRGSSVVLIHATPCSATTRVTTAGYSNSVVAVTSL